MRNKLIVLCLIMTPTIGLFAASSSLDKMIPKDKQSYIVPCAVVLATGMILTGEDSLQASTGVCAGLITYNYITRKNGTSKDNVNSRLRRFTKSIKKKIRKNNEVAKENYSAYRDTIRKLVVEEFDNYNKAFLKNAKMYDKIKHLKMEKPKPVNEDKIVEKVLNKIRETIDE